MMVNRPGDPPVKLRAFMIPKKKPTIPPATIVPIIAARFCNVTPYNAGSVIPQTAVIPAEVARAFLSVSFVLNAIARAAPP